MVFTENSMPEVFEGPRRRQLRYERGQRSVANACLGAEAAKSGMFFQCAPEIGCRVGAGHFVHN